MAELIREIVIDATPETIWPFLTEADKHVEWIGTVAEIDPRPGGIYRVLVGGQHQSAGEFVEVVPKEKVVFTFGWDEKDHPIPPGSTTRRDHVASRGRQDARAPRAPRPSRRRGRRSRPRLGALPRAAGDRGNRRRRRSRRALPRIDRPVAAFPSRRRFCPSSPDQRDRFCLAAAFARCVDHNEESNEHTPDRVGRRSGRRRVSNCS